MTDQGENTFRPIDGSSERRFGRRALFLVGFAPEAGAKLAGLAAEIGAAGLRFVYCTDEMLTGTLGEALATEAQPPDVKPADLPPFLVLSGFSGAELHAFLNRFAETGLPRPIFASATPNNQSSRVKDLLRELAAEHVEMMALRRRQMESA
jgi:hypothetical protein